MPTVIYSKKEVEKLIGKKLSLNELKERISYLGTDLEGIEGDDINVEIFPNRPDLLSLQGFARALSSFIGAKTGLIKYEVKDSGEKVIIDKSVAKVRPYTACAIVKEIKFDEEKIKEVIQVQEKLHITYGRNRKKLAIGIYPFEKIKTPIKYFAEDPKKIKFKPLESKKQMTGLQVLSQHSAGREYGMLLEGLDKFPFFSDSEGKILSMPPIINSDETGRITKKTTDVFIECSGFDLKVLEKCLNMIVCSLADMGGKIYSMTLEYGSSKKKTPNLKPEPMKLDIKYVNERLGLELKEKDVKKLLEKMGYGYEKGKALIPSYRADILHQIDLIEDIAIAYGYEKTEEIIPAVATIGEENKFEIFKNKVAEILTGLGLLEVNTFNLTNRKFQNKLMKTELELVDLSNSLSQEYDVLRTWVIPSLLEVLKSNKNHDYPQNIFGIGTVFKKNNKTETGVEENDRVAAALCSEDADYTKIKQAFDYLFRMIDVKYEIKEVEAASYIPGRVARVSVNGQNIAYIGELNPNVISNWDLEMPVAVFELNLTELFEKI